MKYLNFKKISQALIIGLLIIVFFSQTKVLANDIEFEAFDKTEYPVLDDNDEIAEEIRAFALKTLIELEACQGISADKPEDDHQSVYCSNFYEADRLRLAFLYHINANQKINEDKKDDYWNFIYAPNYKTNSGISTSKAEYVADYDSNDIFMGASNANVVLRDIKTTKSLSKEPINYPYLKAVNKTFQQCEVNNMGDDGSFSKRLFSINKTKTVNDYMKSFSGKKRAKNDNKKDDKKEDEDEEETEEGEDQKIEKSVGYHELNCNVLYVLLEYYTNLDNIKHSLDNQIDSSAPNWLGFNKIEKKYFIFDEDELKALNQRYVYQRSTECGFTGIKSLLCTFSRFSAKSVDTGEAFLEYFLRFRLSPVAVLKMRILWTNFQKIANIILIITFLFMIFSQLTGFKLTQWGAKALLPKLILVSIFINLSFYIFVGMLDLSTILGESINGLFAYIENSVTLPEAEYTWNSIFKFMGVAMITIFAIFNFFVFFLIIIAMLIALFIIFVLIAGRNILIIMIIITSPVFIALSILPRTEKFFRTWLKSIPIVFFLYPLAILLKNSGDLLSRLMNNESSHLAILSLLFKALPFYILPILLIKMFNSYGVMGESVNRLVNRGKKAYSNTKDSNFYKRLKARQQISANRARKGVYKGYNPALKLTSKYNQGMKKIAPSLYYTKLNNQGDEDANKAISEIEKKLNNNGKLANALIEHYYGDGFDVKELIPSDQQIFESFGTKLNKFESLAILKVASRDDSGKNFSSMAKILDQHVKDFGVDENFYPALENVIAGNLVEGRVDNAYMIHQYLNSKNKQGFDSIAEQMKNNPKQAQKDITNYINSLPYQNFSKFNFSSKNKDTELNKNAIIYSFAELQNRIDDKRNSGDEKAAKELQELFDNRLLTIRDSEERQLVLDEMKNVKL